MTKSSIIYGLQWHHKTLHLAPERDFSGFFSENLSLSPACCTVIYKLHGWRDGRPNHGANWDLARQCKHTNPRLDLPYFNTASPTSRCWREQNRSLSRKLVHLCHLHSIARSHQICQQCYVTLLIFVLNDCIYIYAKKLENKVPSLTCPQSRSITGFQLISYLGNHISVTSMGKSIPASREPLIACRIVPKSDISTWH